MTTVWMGTAGWSYLPDWVGSFYPEGTTASSALSRYVEAFRFVEIDSTFYAAPAASTIERWASRMPPVFKVACKAPKELVQDTQMQPPDVPMRHFCESLNVAFGDRLAGVVVQMQPSFARTAETTERFVALAERWPFIGAGALFVEFRHASWFDDDIAALARALDVTIVSNDLHDVPSLGRRFADTNDQCAYLRLIGRHDGIAKDRIVRPQSDGIEFWTERVVALAERNVGHVFVVANNHYEGHAPQTLRTLTERLTERGVFVAPCPGWPDGPVSMF